MWPKKCFLVLLSLLSNSFSNVEAQYRGNSCTFGFSGVCTLLQDCQYAINQLTAGRRPNICGYEGYEAIICCPSGRTTAPTSWWTPTTAPPRPPRTTTNWWERTTPSYRPWGQTTSTTTYSPPWEQTTPNNRPTYEDTSNQKTCRQQRVAERMCCEYSKAVYVKQQTNSPVSSDVILPDCNVDYKALIVGGTQAKTKEFPHMAALGFGPKNQISCGGTLISDRFILTAAHCLYHRSYGKVTYAKVGDLDLVNRRDDSKPQERRVIRTYRHPDHDPKTKHNDIALLELDSPVTFNSYVRPACLSMDNNLHSGERAVAAGWGVTDWMNDEGSNTLLKVVLPIVSSSTCKRYFPNLNPSIQICAGERGKDTCQGDSGGPLMVFSDVKRFYCMYDIVGITSYGKVCGTNVPGIYTKVSSYVPWIESVVWNQY